MQENTPGVTTREVARAAGVAVGTVNRVLNNLPNVDEALRERVMKAVNELGYIYIPKKRASEQETTEKKAVVTSRTLLFWGAGSMREHHPGAHNSPGSYYYELIRGAEYECALRGARLLFMQLANDISAIKQVKECIDEHDVSGLIFVNHNYHALFQELVHMGISMVNIDARTPEELPIDIVASDDLGGAKQLTRHLIGLGHRDIAFINSAPQYVTQVRFDGYRAALNDAGIPYRSELVVRIPSLSYENAQDVVQQLLKHHFTAIFCGNDTAAFGAIRALTAAGLHVPHDVSVVGFDDHEMAALFNPPLTTIHAGTFEKGRIAIAHLLDRIAYPEKPISWSQVPVQLIVRASTAPIAT